MINEAVKKEHMMENWNKMLKCLHKIFEEDSEDVSFVHFNHTCISTNMPINTVFYNSTNNTVKMKNCNKSTIPLKFGLWLFPCISCNFVSGIF
jgi:hypothetical protein